MWMIMMELLAKYWCCVYVLYTFVERGGGNDIRMICVYTFVVGGSLNGVCVCMYIYITIEGDVASTLTSREISFSRKRLNHH